MARHQSLTLSSTGQHTGSVTSIPCQLFAQVNSQVPARKHPHLASPLRFIIFFLLYGEREEKKSRPHLLLFTIEFHQNDFTAPLIVFSSFPLNFVLDFRGPARLRTCTNSLTFSADKSISSREQFGCAMFLLFSTICPLGSLARSWAL